MKKSHVELLSPAGSFEGLKAVCNAGADAVYVGGNLFGARAYANNLDQEHMLEAIDYVHIHDKKLYLTVNTLLKNKELEEQLYSYLLPYYEQGLDAVIVQDLGVLSFVHEHFPDLPVHASTQMAITGAKSAAFLKEQGASRIVTARELSLEEIRQIKKEADVEIESFVHGALCYCYSGMCLFSSMLGGRSGNRGRCAQPCRLPYQVYDHGKLMNDRNSSYPLSPKDMCTIELLPQIIEAGVHSLKIEGRMKKPEYAAGVTSIYRKYLDLFMENPKNYHVLEQDKKMLFDLYNRDGFNQSYYLTHNGRQMMAVKNEKLNKSKQEMATEALYAQIKKRYLDTEIKEKINAFLYLSLDSPAILTLQHKDYEVVSMGSIVQPALKQPLSRERIAQQMNKLGNTPFVLDTLEIEMSDDIFIPMQNLNELRRNALEELSTKILNSYRRSISETSSKYTKIASLYEKKEQLYSAVVETQDQLEVVLKESRLRRIYVSIFLGLKKNRSWSVTELISKVHKAGKECYIALPYIMRKDYVTALELKRWKEEGADGFLVRNLESFSVLKAAGLEAYAFLDFHMYCANDRAVSFWEKQKTAGYTIPLELNQREIENTDYQQGELLIYGYYPMMISAQCVKKTLQGCTHQDDRLMLKDRYKQNFPVQCYCDACYNVIYNSLPTGLLKEYREIKKLPVSSLRFSFTLENKEETKNILKLFFDVYENNKKVPDKVPCFTKGHFKRGVE